MALTGSHALSPSHKKSCDELWPYGSFEPNKTPEKSCLRCGLSRGHLCRPFDQNWRGDCLTHNCSLPPSPQQPTVLYLPTCCWAVLTRHAQKLPVLVLTQICLIKFFALFVVIEFPNGFCRNPFANSLAAFCSRSGSIAHVLKFA